MIKPILILIFSFSLTSHSSEPSLKELASECAKGSDTFIPALDRFRREAIRHISNFDADKLVGEAITNNEDFFVFVSAYEPELLKPIFNEFDFFLSCSKTHRQIIRNFIGTNQSTDASKSDQRELLSSWNDCLVLTYGPTIPKLLVQLQNCYESKVSSK